ncbi:MAG: hypothetical protein ABIK20_05335 [Candidatus Omnitrophota bacterium]
MKLKEIEKKYKNEWVLARVLKEDNLGQPAELKILAHNKDRSKVYHKLSKTKEKDVATFYAGEIRTKGYAVALNGSI